MLYGRFNFNCSFIFFTEVKNVIVMLVSPWCWCILFLKIGTNDVNMLTWWCVCLPCYNVFGCCRSHARRYTTGSLSTVSACGRVCWAPLTPTPSWSPWFTLSRRSSSEPSSKLVNKAQTVSYEYINWRDIQRKNAAKMQISQV